MFKHVFKRTFCAAIDNCPAGSPSRVGKQLRCPSDLYIYFEQWGQDIFRIACNFADLFFSTCKFVSVSHRLLRLDLITIYVTVDSNGPQKVVTPFRRNECTPPTPNVPSFQLNAMNSKGTSANGLTC